MDQVPETLARDAIRSMIIGGTANIAEFDSVRGVRSSSGGTSELNNASSCPDENSFSIRGMVLGDGEIQLG